MPRKSRFNVAGTVAHIMAGSLSGEFLFRDDEDRAVFISLFGKYLDLVKYRCYARVLMSNHHHIRVQVEISSRIIAQNLQWISRLDRSGHSNSRYVPRIITKIAVAKASEKPEVIST
jgi:hypothetical protein